MQKYIAMCGCASRRAAEKLIEEGKVTVNGRTVTEQGLKITGKETVTVEGKVIKPEKKNYYIVMNKPSGYICAASDDRGRPCVVDLVAEDIPARLFPVGRLDYDTTGLLILTNDGKLTQKLTHPSHEVWKTYRAVLKGTPTENDVSRVAAGIELEDGKTAPAVLDVVGYKGSNAIAEISIREGRNHQVKRMMEKIGHPVLKLERISIGALQLGGLKQGQWRHMKQNELESLLKED